MPIKWEREIAEKMVQRLYRHLFEREPERDILNGLVAYFTEGRLSVRTQVMRMLKSDEFFDKRLRGKAPPEIAKELYHFILVRPPESTDALQGAADFIGNVGWRVEVDIMLNSEEYLVRFGDDNVPSIPPAASAAALERQGRSASEVGRVRAVR
jgi:phycobilisome linker polypeptide